MEEYSLQANEAVLYKGRAVFDDGTIRGGSDILLTNINLVATIKTKKLLQKEQVEVVASSVSEIKVYEGIPQIKQKDTTVEIYFTSEVVRLIFDSKLTVLKFINAINKLVTGKSMPERGADKFKGAVNLVDDALGIKTVDTIKGVVENGVVGTVFGGIGKKKKTEMPSRASSTANAISEVVGVTKSLVGTKQSDNHAEIKQEKTLDEQIEAVKKLKGLLDAGILTQEEFDAKKKQIMSI